MKRMQYEDVQFLTSVLRKLDAEEAATLLSIIIHIIEDGKNEWKRCEAESLLHSWFVTIK